MKISTKDFPFLVVIFLLFSILFIYLGINLFSTILESEFLGRTFFYVAYLLIYLGGALGSAAIAIYAYKRKLSRVADYEREESYRTGAVKEKLLDRELFEWEKAILEEKFEETKDPNFDLDRRSPVFRIQGQLVKLEPQIHKQIRLTEEWNVRGLVVNEDNYPDIRYKDFNQGDQVVVEFSPFSKWVWDIYKVVNGKRLWMMNLAQSSFQYLAEGGAKVIPRAPFGTHQIDQIRSGDLITFSCLDISKEGVAQSVNTEVEYVRRYASADDLIKAEGLDEVCPGVKSFEEAVNWLNSIKGYEARIQKGGIYALRVKLLK
jgi:ASC-1-like (ASCH) protein